MVCKTSALLFFFFFFNILFTSSQSVDVQIRVYGAEDAISHRNIEKVAQDSNGLIWIATFSGLNRFDGYSFKNYFQKNLSQNPLFENLSDLLLQPNGTIWLARDNKLLHFLPESGQTKSFNTFEKDSAHLRVKVTNHLFPFSDSLFLFTVAVENEQEVALYQSSFQFEPTFLINLPGKYDHHPISVFQEFIWAGTNENELWKLSPNGQLIEKFTILNDTNKDLFSGRIVHLFPKHNKLWILLDNNQLFFIDSTTTKPIKHPLSDLISADKGASCLSIQDDGSIWVSGYKQLWFLDPIRKKAVNYHQEIQQVSKGVNMYRNLFTDYAGTLWVSSDFGLIKIVRSPIPFESFLNGGNENCSNGYCSIRGMTKDKSGNIYASYYNSIHKIYPDGTVTPVFSKERFVNPPFGLLYLNEKLYTGNGRILDLAAQTSTSLFEENPLDKGVVVLKNDYEVWFGYGNKLYRYFPETDSLDIFSDSLAYWPHQIDISYLFFEKSYNKLWIASGNIGAFRLDLQTKMIEHYQTRAKGAYQISHNTVNAICESGDHIIWFATANGLLQLKDRNQWQIFNTSSGLPNQYINGMLDDGDSCLWISTNNGLSRMNVHNLTFTNYYKEDGLSENEFNRMAFLNGNDGKMYFGGINGINAFFPDNTSLLDKTEPKGKVILTRFSHFNSHIDSLIVIDYLKNPSAINLSHHDRFFTFEFALTNYAQPGKNRFAYFLEGFDPDWSEESTYHTARYHNIPPGNYTFHIRAAASKGSKITETFSLPVNIKQPYYQKSWFLLSIPLFLSAILLGIYRYSIFRAKKQERLLQEEVKVRTKELEEQKRKSDELLLNILPAETAQELMQFGKAKARKHNEVSVLFSDFQSFTKIAEQLDPEVLVNEIDFCFRNFDAIIEKYQLEKIKTIGDAYMCVGGISDKPQYSAPAVRIVKAALEMQSFLKMLALKSEKSKQPVFRARIGIHTGPVVSGIVGSKKFAYDIWGDTVNVASRLERHCEIGKVNISQTTFQLVKDAFICEYRGKISAKNKGDIDMYYIERLR